MKIPFNKPFIVGKELYYIAQAVQSGQLSGDGIFTRRAQRWLEERLGCRKALLTHSCTAALEMAAILCDVGPGDEVIMPSFTFVSTANAFVLRGARPVFIDVRADTLNIDERRIEPALSERTKAIVVVHYGGVACDMDPIMRIARTRGLTVVEDAAHALLGRWRSAPLGAVGHLGCLSFHETKNVISGEGGALLINDERLVRRAEIIREKGTDRSAFFRGEIDKYSWRDIGSSFLPSELVAAFLWGQIEHADAITEGRLRRCERYRERLAPLAGAGCFELPPPFQGTGPVFFLLARDQKERDALLAHLRSAGIQAVFHYLPLHSSPAGRQWGRSSGTLDNTDRISATLVRLPLYYEMSDAEQDRVVEEVARFYCA
jgi:dTDP-4-amino-4,6-dideoxygalactose transaminase